MKTSDFIKKFKKDRSPCVYRLLLDGLVVYVGSTTNPSARIYQHSFSDKEFDSVSYDLFDSYEDLPKHESSQIVKYNPKLNISIPANNKTILLARAVDKFNREMYSTLRELPFVFSRKGSDYISTEDLKTLITDVKKSALDSLEKIQNKGE